MLGSYDVIAFVATTDAARAKAFYEGTLGLRLLADDGFALAFDAHGTMLRVAKVPELRPARHTVLGWSVPDVESTVRELAARGVAFERLPGLPQDALGICALPGAKVAWFKDPDGNTLSVTQFDSDVG